MSRFLPAPLVAILFFTVLASYTAVWCLMLTLVGLILRMAPGTGWASWCRKHRLWIFTSWAWMTRQMYRIFHHGKIEVNLPKDLNPQDWYMIVSNHTSWADIPLLIAFLQKDMPQVAFFLKKQLIWVPIVGWIAYFADMPFMERYSRAYLRKHPEKRGKDLEATRKACEKFADVPVSLINFLEGSRFTAAKHAAQHSPYSVLLKPKTGGFAYAVSAMDGKMKQVVDVTLVYSGRNMRSFMDQLGGKAGHIVIDAKLRTLPEDFLGKDYQNDKEFRAAFQGWVNMVWAEKEQRILEIKKDIGDDPADSFPWPAPETFESEPIAEQASS